MQNWIPDQNPYKLAAPPLWWLRKLWDFDDSLVVVPSRQGWFYRLAQRRKLNLHESITNDALWRQSDTRMLASYGLIPVTTIIADARWDNPLMWVDLEERAPHRQGGHEKVNRLIEEREREKERKEAVKLDQHLHDVSKDGWKYYQAKTGQRTFIDRTKQRSAAPTLKLGQRTPKPSLPPGRSDSQRRIILAP